MEIEEIKKILFARGIKIYVEGCGCCSSPIVKIECDGNVIVDEERFNIDMFGDIDNGLDVKPNISTYIEFQTGNGKTDV